MTDVVENVEKRVEFSWDSVIEAIIEVESSGDSLAVCDIYCGAMQISPIVVADCNETLAKRGETRRYTLQDRFSVEKSKEMFCLIQDRYNPEKDVEKAIRVWNAGPSYTLRSTETYYRKVVSAMNID
ncbi:MAG: lytic transglycosylase domain-containing protein [Bacteroidaceae bacterium]|nr:lytic transglycosylase domain-containing protein [Bacteroidaceae bacterium]